MIKCWRGSDKMRQVAKELLPPICIKVIRRVLRGESQESSYPTEVLPPILIFQMGKVGSKTMEATLRSAYPEREIHRLHMLTPQTWAEMESWCWCYDSTLPVKYMETTLRHIHQSKILRLRIEMEHRRKSDGAQKKWKIITMTRDPVAYAVSAFFQMIDTLLPGIVEQYTWDQKALEQARSFFIRQVEVYCTENSVPRDAITQVMQFLLRWPLIWFEREMQGVFGRDLYAEEFPIKRGFAVYPGELEDILVVRFEDLFSCLGECLSAFFGMSPPEIQAANVTRKNAYYPMYKAFLDTVALPEEFLRKQYMSVYARHFYSDDELNGFVRKWAKQA